MNCVLSGKSWMKAEEPMVVGENQDGSIGEGSRSPKSGFLRPTPVDSQSDLSKTNGGGSVMDVAIRCTKPACKCECFLPGKPRIRYCDTCGHGWVAHALDKLGSRGVNNHANADSVEPVTSNVVFDVASLFLYGCSLIPTHLKILLDRLISVLPQEDIVQILKCFGWSPQDYDRGYVRQDGDGMLLDAWSTCDREEVALIFQQFLRFGETKKIAQRMLMNEQEETNRLKNPPKSEVSGSDIKKFLERTVVSNNAVPAKAEPKEVKNDRHQAPSASPPRPPTPPRKMDVQPTANRVPSPKENKPNANHASPLNRLESMQPFDFRKIKLETGLPGLPPGMEMLSKNFPPPGMAFSSLADQQISMPSLINSTPGQPPNPGLQFPRPFGPGGLVSLQMPIPMSLVPPIDTMRHMPRPVVSISGTSPSVSTSSQESTPMTPRLDSNALNLTRLGNLPDHHHHHSDKHLRKSSNPLKRRWDPINFGTSLISPSTGKKRVQCNVCLKTFCDKGALKIHFSAVHLREMHKCTVDGCNMMFSSRRSRNRHSANPNPKLHTPHLRRKISPHDGRSSHPHGGFLPPNLMNPMGVGGPGGPVPPSLNPMNPLGPGFNPLGPGFNPMFPQAALDLHKAGSLDLSIPKSSYYGFKGMDFEHLIQAQAAARKSDDGDNGPSSAGSSSSPVMNLTLGDGRRIQDIDGMSDCSDMGDYHSTGTGNDSQDNLLDDDDDIDDEMDDMDDDDDDEYDSSEPSSNKKLLKDEVFKDHPASVSPPRVQEDDVKPIGLASSGVRKRKSQNPIKCFSAANDIVVGKAEVNETWKPYQDDERREENHGSPGSHSSVDLRMLNNNVGGPEEEDQSKASEYNGGDGGEPTGALNHLERLSQGTFGNSRDVMEADGENEPAEDAFSDPGSPGSDSDDVPLDKDNPRRCSACGKMFLNHFGVKTHYQNVHLKLMHKCTVEGCNAAFPSKRSRDRHSSNLNLHRKLLSTSDKPAALPGFDRPPFPLDPAIRNDIFARIYGSTDVAPRLPGFPEDTPPELIEQLLSAAKDTAGRFFPAFPFFLPGMAGLPAPQERSNGESSGNSAPKPVYILEDDLPTPDRNGNMPCKFCHKAFPDGDGLKEHYETSHLSDLFPCTVPGCPKLFSSRKKRNCHSLNESQHLNI